MRPIPRIISAFIISPAIIAAAATGILQPVNLLVIFSYAAVVTYAHTVLFAVPIYFLLQRMGWLRISTVLLSSVLIGVLPIGLVLFLGPYADYSVAGSDVHVENGLRTITGIFSSSLFALAAGGLGLATGIVWVLIAGKSAITQAQMYCIQR
jgi:hypothetical protein